MNENLRSKLTASAPYLLAVLRIAVALMFMLAGSSKLFGFPVAMPDGSTAQAFTQVWIGGVLEVFGGFFILTGFFTRIISFILSGEMAVAYFQFHSPQSPWPTVNGGVSAVLYCFIFLYFIASGPGAWSIDGILHKASNNKK